MNPEQITKEECDVSIETDEDGKSWALFIDPITGEEAFDREYLGGDQDDDRSETRQEEREKSEDEKEKSEDSDKPEPDESEPGPETEANGEAGEAGEGLEGAGEAGEMGAEGAEAAELAEAAEVAEGAEAALAVEAVAAPEEAAAAGGVIAFLTGTPVGWVIDAVVGGTILIIALAFFLALMGAMPEQASGTTTGSSSSTTKTVICVDPGHVAEAPKSTTDAQYAADEKQWNNSHSGGDEGASGGGYTEREINQEVADLLVAELNSRGYDAEETKHDANGFMTSKARGQFCQTKKAQLIVKVHNDDASGFKGMTFWYPSVSVIKQKENDKSLIRDGINPYTTSAGTITDDMTINNDLKTAFVLGQKKYSYTYPSTTKANPGGSNHGFGYDYDIPTTLLEMSNMADSANIKFITNKSNQQKIVKSFADGIQNYVPPSTGGAGLVNGALDVFYYNQFTSGSCGGGTHWATTGGVGCGATSEAMIARFILNDTKITPDFVNRTINGTGDHWDVTPLNAYLKKHGSKVQYTEKSGGGESALKDMEASIKKGYPAVGHMQHPFACSTHVVVITGFDDKGNVYVNDPNCFASCKGRPGKDPYLKFGTPAGKNNLAPRKLFEDAITHYDVVE